MKLFIHFGYHLIYSFALLFFLSPGIAFAEKISFGRVPYSIYFLEDKTGALSLENISSLPDSTWKLLDGKELSAGFSHSTYWLKVESDAFIKDKLYYFEIEFPPLDQVDFYYKKKNGEFHVSTSGDTVPIQLHEVKNRNLVYPYRHLEKQSLYFRIKTNSTIYFPLKIWDEYVFSDKVFYEQFFMGIYFGIILVMVIYNFFLFLNIRERLYLYYVIYVLSLFIFMLVDHGYARLFLWDNNIALNNIMNPLMGQVTTILAVLFTIDFLRLRNNLGKLAYVTRFEIVGFIFGIAGIFFIRYEYLLVYVNILVLLTAITLIYLAIQESLKKNQMGYFYLLAFGGFMLIVGYSSIANLGIVSQSFSSTYGMIFASAFEVSVLSFALGYRINRLKKEKEFFEFESRTTKHSYNLLKNEVEIAANIQSSILPSGSPQMKGLIFETLYLPHGNVGGDFYDFAEVSPHEIGILVADVTGHGIPAALLASMANFSFTYEKDFAGDPITILNRMNKSLFNRLGKQFITATYVFLDLDTMMMKHSSCGHPPLILYRKETDEIYSDKPKGKMMGVFEENQIEMNEINLEKGDRILIYTDGVSEAISEKDDFDGTGALVEILRSNANKSLADVKESIIDAISKSDFQEDDATLVLIELL